MIQLRFKMGKMGTGILVIIILHSMNGYFCSTSLEKVKKFYDVDETVVESIYQHLSILKDYVAVIQEYVSEHHQMTSGQNVDEEDAESLTKNPLRSFQIIRRITKSRKRLIDYIITISQEFIKQINYEPYQDESLLQEDLIEAGEGIIRLQDVYQLHPSDLQQGKIEHINSSLLSVEDCLILAEVAKYRNRLDFHLEWTELAHRICKDGYTSPGYFTCTFIKSLYENAKSKHDAIWLENQATNPTPYLYSNKDSAILLPNLASEVEPLTQRLQLNQNKIFANNEWETVLCNKRGNMMNISVSSKLKCYYLFRSDDVYSTLQHYKVEEQSITPVILTIYDVISLSEVELFKELSKPIFKRSLVVNSTSDENSKQRAVRVSETGWLDDRNPNIYKISKRVESITGLRVACTNCSEAFQVVNYGIGGLYKSHYDAHNWRFFWPNIKETNEIFNETIIDDRYATFIIYLNDVELGGTTVFPHLRISIKPKTAAATLFYNLNEKGDVIMDTLHGGCPVLFGSKWIANKWIMSNAQMFIRKCSFKARHP